MHGVGHGLFFVGLHWNAELDGLGIFFLEVIGLGGDLPVASAVEVFAAADLILFDENDVLESGIVSPRKIQEPPDISGGSLFYGIAKSRF